jgi:hypothetical protein
MPLSVYTSISEQYIASIFRVEMFYLEEGISLLLRSVGTHYQLVPSKAIYYMYFK